MSSLSKPEDHPTLLVETRLSTSSILNDEVNGDTVPVINQSLKNYNRTPGLLGREIELHLHSPMPRLNRFFLMLLGLIGVLLPLTLGAWQFYAMEDANGYYAALQRSQSWIFLSLVVFFAYFIIIMLRSRNSNDFIALHQNGIRFRLNKKRICWLLYQNIAGLQEELIQEYFIFIPIRKKYRVNISPKNGKTIRIPSSFGNLSELHAQLTKKVHPSLNRVIEHAFFSGKWVEFGEIKLNQNQFCYRNRTIPLDQIYNISIQSGKLRITKKPQASTSKNRNLISRHNYPDDIRIPLSKVFNLDIFLKLIQTRIQP